MNMLNEFNETAGSPYQYGTDYRRRTGKNVVGYFCSYTPEELIFAADALPFRIFGVHETIQRADSHLQTYCCSLVRRSLEDGLSGHLDFLDGVVFPHTCDSIQRLSDIWRLNLTFAFHMDVVLPVKLNTESARAYFTEVVRDFVTDLENALKTKISDEKLKQSMIIYNQIRSNLQRIYEIRRENPNVIKGSDVYAIVRSSMMTDRKLLKEKLSAVVADLETKKKDTTTYEGKRLVLAGGVCTHPDMYHMIEEAGGAVVWDDFCTGSRYFEGMLNVNEEPITAIAVRYFNRIICPAKHAGLTGRAENILEMVKKSGADGVIFLLLKFCDPNAFDYPYIKDFLDKEGIPCMLFEMEDGLPAEGQLKTRLEAFLEMI